MNERKDTVEYEKRERRSNYSGAFVFVGELMANGLKFLQLACCPVDCGKR